jgi:cystathionine beta-lyase/cystathionine gamma-synthase
VDNTFLTAALQRPFELGADVVVYSTTKFVEGHNATLGGALLARKPELGAAFALARKTLGCGQSPLEAWLTLRGLATLDLRVRRHSQNALEVARFLEQHPAVEHVAYPGLESFPQRALAARQQDAGGGVLAFELVGGRDAGVALLNAVRLAALAENLGAAETLVTHPASMTSGDIPRAQREAAGITEGLLRLSVGLEEPRDLIADLERALAAAAATAEVTR